MAVLTSRRLWTFVIAQIVSLATLIIGHALTDPFALQIGTLVIGMVEGLAGILIVSFTVDDSRLNVAQVKAQAAVEVAAVQAGTHPDFPPVKDNPETPPQP